MHFHVLNNITSNSDNVHNILKTKFHNYPRARLSPLSDKQYRLVQVGKQLRPRIQAISTTSNVVVAAHMETEVITEHWFREEVEGSDRCGRQCGHGDDSTEEEGDGNDDEGS
ncbi:hypothetical protein AHAS_Ahas09G0150900 [Arachis hypogaea]